MITNLSNLDKWRSDAHFVSLLYYYYCTKHIFWLATMVYKHKNWVPSILPYNLWLMLTNKKSEFLNWKLVLAFRKDFSTLCDRDWGENIAGGMSDCGSIGGVKGATTLLLCKSELTTCYTLKIRPFVQYFLQVHQLLV